MLNFFVGKVHFLQGLGSSKHAAALFNVFQARIFIGIKMLQSTVFLLFFLCAVPIY